MCDRANRSAACELLMTSRLFLLLWSMLDTYLPASSCFKRVSHRSIVLCCTTNGSSMWNVPSESSCTHSSFAPYFNHKLQGYMKSKAQKYIINSIGGLVVKLAVAIRDLASQLIRPAPGSIPGRCIFARLIACGGCGLIFLILAMPTCWLSGYYGIR